MRFIYPVLLTCLATSLVGCESEDHEEHLAGYENTLLEGEVTDETLVSFVAALEAAEPADSATRSPTLQAPADGADLGAGTPPTFSWEVGGAARPLHGDPYTGYATYLELRGAGTEPSLQVFTSGTTYTPAQDVWDGLVAEGGTFTVELIGAEFEANRLAQDGGPYAGSTTTFGVAP